MTPVSASAWASHLKEETLTWDTSISFEHGEYDSVDYHILSISSPLFPLQYHTILPGNLFSPQADVTVLHKQRIDCDVTINYVYTDVPFNLPSNNYVVYF
jgi:hypothetical protein